MRTTTLLLALGLALAIAAPVVADAVDDDLAVVRKATAAPHNEPQITPEAAPRRSGDEPKWFRVRIVEKGKKKATVKVNLPLSLVHAIGDDVPIPGCEDQSGRKSPTFGEVLRSLDSGENLVEIDDDYATVRVWVE